MIKFSQEDYEWIVKNCRSFFQHYHVNLKSYHLGLPQTIIFRDNEPRIWIYSHKNMICKRSQDYNNLQTLKNFIVLKILAYERQHNPDKEIQNFITKALQNKNTSSNLAAKQDIHYIIQKLKQKTKLAPNIFDKLKSKLFLIVHKNIYKIMPSGVFLMLILSNRIELFRSISNLIYMPQLANHGSKLIQTNYLRKKGMNKLGKFQIKESVSNHFPPFPLMVFQKDDLDQENFPNLKLKSIIKTFDCLEETTDLLNRLISHFNSKFKPCILSGITILSLIDARNIFLIGVSSIDVCQPKEDSQVCVDLSGVSAHVQESRVSCLCKGLYCDQLQKGSIFEQGDLQFGVMDLNKSLKEESESQIVFKSIILDIIQSVTTKMFVEEALKILDREDSVSQNFLLRNRRYVSISKLLNNPLFKFFTLNNLYQRVRVCRNCFLYYQLIDYNRSKQFKEYVSDHKFLRQMIRSLQDYNGSGMKSIDVKALVALKFKNLVELLDQFQKQENPLRKPEFKVVRKTLNKSTKISYSKKISNLAGNTHFVVKQRQVADKSKLAELNFDHILSHTRTKWIRKGEKLSKSLVNICKLQGLLNESQKIFKRWQEEDVFRQVLKQVS